ncbi:MULTISPECIES: diacylglycerol/lipid kinase family protein [Marinobacter]|uniref:diacylglycerol/lipid kinase family protein n=1 Tax=Marinobacter TaxID=2742 RepID=UPI001D098BC8|nr:MULTISPECIES: diacylglycerol kinase family protein [Marinobacter]MCK7565573.1 diacylglycerol kinase family lipid kinase [Marinobacter xestospongiae]UDL06282.1 diacylglycerol kinase family lipid kinase [Marinobacter sp. CA1]
MTYWLVANGQAGDGGRGRDFWVSALVAAGIEQPRCCEFDDPAWQQEAGPGDVVMVAGGDGSANLGARVCTDTGATLAVLPSGTANDFARNLALPDDPDALCRLIARGESRAVDVAVFGEQIFLNVAHVGLGTLPVRRGNGSRKRLLGRFSYGVELIRQLGAKRGFRATIECDRGQVSGRWLSVAVASGAFYGGGNEIPQAAADDGLLDVIAVRPRPLLQLLLTFVMVRLNRQAPRRTSTLLHLKGRQCRIGTRKPKTVTADGEVVGKTPLTVTCRPGCLKVIASTVVSTVRN